MCSGCYSFTGGGSTLSKEVKTIQIEQFLNNTIFPNTSLAPEFTNRLQNIFHNRTSLIAVDHDSDLVLEGEFTKYDTEVFNISNDRIQGSRLRVKVKVSYKNKKQPTKDFEQEFETVEDFSSDETLLQAGPRLIPLIVERLSNEVFNKVYNDW
ncbi:MAG: LptE family protein [Flavobacteriales bacterium Tduv]